MVDDMGTGEAMENRLLNKNRILAIDDDFCFTRILMFLTTERQKHVIAGGKLVSSIMRF
jgi:hypothetical protein